jgi:superfamily II DNA or RNA helicase
MVDEVHKAKADVLRNLLGGVFANVPIRWGLTGTIPKDEHEAVSTFCSLGPVVGNLSSKELQDMGVLADLDVNIFQLQDGVLGFNSYAQELKWLLTDDKRIDHISEIIRGLATSGNTLVLIDRIKTGEMLIERNDDWVFVSGKMKTTDRQDEYAEISEMDNKVIVATYGVAAVGINIPRIFNLVMLEPGKSFVRVIQSIGRGIRKAEDKDYVQVVDITSNLKYSKRHLTKRKQFYKEQNFRHKVTKVEYK